MSGKCSRNGCNSEAYARGMCASHYVKIRSALIYKGQWDGPIDATGTIRRLRALAAMGWPMKELAAMSGVAMPTISYLMHHRRGTVYSRTAGKVADLYDELSMREGNSQRSRLRARRHGWAPPLAWDDETIDDPNAQPDVGEQVSVKFGEKFTELRDLGYSDLVIAQRFGIKPASLLRQLDRYGIEPDPELVTETTRVKHRADRRYAS